MVHHITPHRRGQDLQPPCQVCQHALSLMSRPDQISGQEPLLKRLCTVMCHLCFLSLLFFSLIVSVIFNYDVAVERHIPFPYYSNHILSLNDY